MKIGIYDPYLDDVGGGEKYMLSIAENLSKKHSVCIFWENESDLKVASKRFSLDLSNVKLTSNIFSKGTFFLSRFFHSRKYDLIIFLSDGSIPFVFPKLLIHIQQPLENMQTSGLLNRLKTSRVKSFFANSQYTKYFIEKKFPINSKVIYPPVKLTPRSSKKENIILHVGRFRARNVNVTDYKKQTVMVQVFKEMVKSGLDGWKFVLVAGVLEKDAKTFESLKKSANGFPIEFSVNKTNDSLWNFYSRAKIYWHASGFGEDLEKHPEYAEHFGISTVEAMGAGAVPVVINVGGQKEIVKDGESGFFWDSLEELKKKTLKLIEDNELREKMSEKAKERAKDFSKEKFEDAINKLIS